MYTTETPDEERLPLNQWTVQVICQIYNQGLRVIKTYMIKISEFEGIHRCEPSGSLHGLMRVRGFTQDDAHIFCTEIRLQKIRKVTKLILDIYKAFGFNDVILKYADDLK